MSQLIKLHLDSYMRQSGGRLLTIDRSCWIVGDSSLFIAP